MSAEQDTGDKKSIDTVVAPPSLLYEKDGAVKEDGTRANRFLRSVTIAEEEGPSERELRLRRQVSVGRRQHPDQGSQVVSEFRLAGGFGFI